MVPIVPDPPLGDGVVTLRPPDERDLAAIDLGINDPDVVRWFGPPDGTAIEMLALNRRRCAAGSPTLAICEQDDVCVGHVWVNRSADDTTRGAMGYWLLPSARGRGLATRSVRLITRWAFDGLGITRLRISADPANEPSQRVAERNGFGRLGLVVGYIEVDGHPEDRVVFELLADGHARSG